MQEQDEVSMLQVVRQSHCERRGEGHACAGTVSIGPKGVKLDCQICGSGSVGEHTTLGLRECARILEACGIDFGSLSHEAQIAAARAYAEDMCPGCGTRHVPSGAYDTHLCPCGEYLRERRFNGLHWRSRKEAEQ